MQAIRTARTVAENTVAGEAIGAPVAATDPDNGDTLTYTLGGADAASFDIVSTSGQAADEGGPRQGDQGQLHGDGVGQRW